MNRWLDRLGLRTPEIRAWALYDWANSAFMTTIVLVYGIYYPTVAGADLPPAVATERFAWTTTLAMTIVAVLSPVLGAVADAAGAKKKMLAAFIVFGVTSTALLFTVQRGEWVWGAVLYILGNIGVTASFVFYESLLPHIAREDEIDRVSTAGYALGYIGGGTILAINLLWINKPEWFGLRDAELASRVSFVSAALWWAVFSIPCLLRVPEPPVPFAKPRSAAALVGSAVTDIAHTLRDLRGYRNAFLLLVAFMLYNDGIQTIIRMATPYGTELGISRGALIGTLVVTQFVGVPFAFLFGALAGRLGPKRTLYIPLAVYFVITVLAYRMKTAADFFVLAMLVATVQGGSQAISRSLFATLIPRHKSAEFFAFFGVFEKFAGIFGPLIFAAMIRFTGSSRPAILAIVVFFAAGGLLLTRVNVEEGRRRAREEEARVLAEAG
ncbi:MAG TPA: MFS transporter [Vicinamibacteria bacterium]|nr:MFS transporter [Vicinamibacteria bacterium]